MDAGHLTAGFGAAMTDLRAPAHLVVVAHLLAVERASLAQLGADTARLRVEFRTAEHEISAGPADLRAVREQPNVRLRAVLSSHGQAMLDRSQTRGVTLGAVVDALLHIVMHSRSP
jgi:hypothetical protein